MSVWAPLRDGVDRLRSRIHLGEPGTSPVRGTPGSGSETILPVPTAPTAPRPAPAWPGLRPVQRSLDHPLEPVAPLDAFTASLAAYRNPSFLAPLSHQVDGGAGGVADGLVDVTPGTPRTYASGNELTVRPTAAVESTQRVTVQRGWGSSLSPPEMDVVAMERPDRPDQREVREVEEAGTSGSGTPESPVSLGLGLRDEVHHAEPLAGGSANEVGPAQVGSPTDASAAVGPERPVVTSPGEAAETSRPAPGAHAEPTRPLVARQLTVVADRPVRRRVQPPPPRLELPVLRLTGSAPAAGSDVVTGNGVTVAADAPLSGFAAAIAALKAPTDLELGDRGEPGERPRDREPDRPVAQRAAAGDQPADRSTAAQAPTASFTAWARPSASARPDPLAGLPRLAARPEPSPPPALPTLTVAGPVPTGATYAGGGPTVSRSPISPTVASVTVRSSNPADRAAPSSTGEPAAAPNDGADGERPGDPRPEVTPPASLPTVDLLGARPVVGQQADASSAATWPPTVQPVRFVPPRAATAEASPPLRPVVPRAVVSATMFPAGPAHQPPIVNPSGDRRPAATGPAVPPVSMAAPSRIVQRSVQPVTSPGAAGPVHTDPGTSSAGVSFAAMFAGLGEDPGEDGYTSVQLAPADAPAPSPAASPPAPEPAAGPAAALAAPAPAGAVPTPAAPADLDEMARLLFEPLSARIRAELWLDRERAGLVTDVRP